MSTPISAAQRQEAQRLLTTSERHLQSAGNVHNLDSSTREAINAAIDQVLNAQARLDSQPEARQP